MKTYRLFTLVAAFVFLFVASGCGVISDLIKSDPIKEMLLATPAGTLERVDPTVVIESTPMVQSTAIPDKVLFFDGFNDPDSGWSIFSDDYGSADYVDGKYQVKAIQENQYNWGVAGKNFDNVKIDVDVDVIMTNSDQNDAFGVDCRIQENGDGYGFRISSDGYYAIELYNNQENIGLVDFEYDDAIFTDGRTNHITAVCDGSQLTLWVNDIQLASVQDSTFSSGDLALTALSFETDPITVAFDNLEVRSIGESSVIEVEGDYSLVISNPTDYEICGVFIVPSIEEFWGENLLSDAEIIAAGESKTFSNLSNSSVDVRAETCEFFTVDEEYEIDLSNTSTLTLEGPRLLLHQPFDSTDGWPSGVVDGGMISNINGDVYSLTVSEAEKLVPATSNYSGQDLVLFANASLVKAGGGGMGIYGITCRMQPDGSGIFFAIRGDGMTSIIGINSGEMEQLTDWASSDYVNAGIDSNYIEADCLGSDFTMFVNGDYRAYVEDTRFQSGKVGVAVFSPAGESTQADFDFLDVYAGE